MTSVYEEKIYPQIPATAPPDDDSQASRLKKIDELKKLTWRKSKKDSLTKRFKRRAKATSISDTSVITANTAIEVTSIVSLATGIGMPISIVIASTGLQDLVPQSSTKLKETQQDQNASRFQTWHDNRVSSAKSNQGFTGLMVCYNHGLKMSESFYTTNITLFLTLSTYFSIPIIIIIFDYIKCIVIDNLIEE